ncbi:MAG: DinB family protein [Chloroflexi bacterium]|nr:DinB family protein [Chloroflexota bacterium]
MDIVRFISQSMSQVQMRLLATCDGLTQEQALWRPAPHANNIGFILWHVGRVEDTRISSLREPHPQIWESQGWYEKFGQSVDAPDPGDRMGLRALSIPTLDVLLGYVKAVHQQTLEFLSALKPDDLDAIPNPSQPERTVADVLRHMITHKNNHHGQIDYIRGLQEETWDLPPGTGAVLPPSV